MSKREQPRKKRAFHWQALYRSIRDVYITPAIRLPNGNVGTSHRLEADGLSQMLDGLAAADTEMFGDKLRECEDFYDFHRPLGGRYGQTPGLRLR